MPDTHLLIWSVGGRLPPNVDAIFNDVANDLFFSVVSIWEAAIKFALNRADFPLHPSVLRERLLSVGYAELHVTGPHTIAVAGLPLLHRDPFDRLLLAQATHEGITLLTADATLASYPGPVWRVMPA